LRLLAVCIGPVISGYLSKTEINFVSVDRIKFRMGIIQTISYPFTELKTWYRRPTPAHDYLLTDEVRYSGSGVKIRREQDPKAILPIIYYLIRRSKWTVCKASSGWSRSPLALMLPCDMATLAHISTVQPHAKEVSDRGIACTLDAPLNYHNRN
jgi:hypothetical protein